MTSGIMPYRHCSYALPSAFRSVSSSQYSYSSEEHGLHGWVWGLELGGLGRRLTVRGKMLAVCFLDINWDGETMCWLWRMDETLDSSEWMTNSCMIQLHLGEVVHQWDETA